MTWSEPADSSILGEIETKAGRWCLRTWDDAGMRVLSLTAGDWFPTGRAFRPTDTTTIYAARALAHRQADNRGVPIIVGCVPRDTARVVYETDADGRTVSAVPFAIPVDERFAAFALEEGEPKAGMVVAYGGDGRRLAEWRVPAPLEGTDDTLAALQALPVVATGGLRGRLTWSLRAHSESPTGFLELTTVNGRRAGGSVPCLGAHTGLEVCLRRRSLAALDLWVAAGSASRDVVKAVVRWEDREFDVELIDADLPIKPFVIVGEESSSDATLIGWKADGTQLAPAPIADWRPVMPQ